MNSTLIVLGAAAAMTALEILRPAERWPRWSGWWAWMATLNAVQIVAVYLAGAWNPWMSRHALFELSRLSAPAGALLGYLVTTFVFYWWHRWRHESDFLWRWFHQVHHSIERVVVVASFYKHPLEIVVDGFVVSLLVYSLLGLAPSAAAGTLALIGLGELFYHWNVRTPYWLGFVFQRPESHRVHHQRGHHSDNFSDLPLWDMLFGTFRNPRDWDGRCGFAPGAERRVGEMLAGIDVSKNGGIHENGEDHGAVARDAGLDELGRRFLRLDGAARRRRGVGRFALSGAFRRRSRQRKAPPESVQRG